MKRLLLLLAVPVVSSAESFTDTAIITSVEPHYTVKTIREPYQECYVKEVYVSQPQGDGSATNELFGAIIGGAIGNQFGSGSGKDAMTIAGAALGASIANDNERSKSNSGYTTQQEVCNTQYRTHRQQVVDYYKVTFNYQGQEFVYRTKYEPSNTTLNVDVSVKPAQRQTKFNDKPYKQYHSR